jgi:lipopolysaccharide export system protein LptA
MTKRRAEAFQWLAALAFCVTAAALYVGPIAAGEAEQKAEPKADQKAEQQKGEATKKSQGGGAGFNKQDPIYITSDRMEADRQKNVLVYIGQVVAIQGDMTLRSDKLTTYFDPDLNQIKQAIAEGKQVRMTQGERTAIGTRAVFDGVAQTITLTGNPVVRQANSEISGSKITYFMVEDKVIVESGKDVPRVNGTIFPEELQQKKDSEPKKAADTKGEPKKAADNKKK